MAAEPAFEPEAHDGLGLLDAVRASKKAEMAEQVRQLRLVIEWCAAHEVEEDEAATYVEFGRDTGLVLAGQGAPFVSEFAVTELATALNRTTDAGKRYVGRVLEVRYRLPGFWEEVTSGRLPWWRAARVAEHTQSLPMDGARFVDRRLSRYAAKVSFGHVERLCEEALIQFDPAQAEEKRQAAMDGRRFDVHADQAGHDGTVAVTGALDLPTRWIWRPRSATTPRSRRPSAPPSRWTSGGRRTPVGWHGGRTPSISTPTGRPASPTPSLTWTVRWTGPGHRAGEAATGGDPRPHPRPRCRPV